jgi:hypothetical protein
VTHVLVATPCNRLEPETIRSIFAQTYGGSIDHHFTRHNPIKAAGLNIIAAYVRLQAVFLAGSYDWLWIVENDLIVPPDALAKLLAVDADIAYGVYLFRRGPPSMNIQRNDTTDPMTNDARMWAREFGAGHVVDCTGLGFGCTLIRRPVLEQFTMRSEYGGGDADTCLARDAEKAGMVQKADLSVVCGHIRPDRVVLWPTADRPFYRRDVPEGGPVPRLDKVRALEPVGVWDEHGLPLIITPEDAEPVAIDFEVAQALVAAGQVVYA